MDLSFFLGWKRDPFCLVCLSHSFGHRFSTSVHLKDAAGSQNRPGFEASGTMSKTRFVVEENWPQQLCNSIHRVIEIHRNHRLICLDLPGLFRRCATLPALANFRAAVACLTEKSEPHQPEKVSAHDSPFCGVVVQQSGL